MLGYRGEGITHSVPMAADHAIAKGDVVAFDADGWLVLAPAGEKNPVGIAAEGRTTGPGEHPHLGFVLHGIAGVRAETAVRAGRAVKVGESSGLVAELPEQKVDPSTPFVLYPNEKVGIALQDIAAGAEGDVFVGA
ncbi:MAG TPA: hypothetical protein VGR28_00645 [Candidatus Thermoplasmatota archaeon]|jgi:predicted RecA/RadA family phage recombinase|nr:hypothetical protein [Candidatus Thermoplasmatota archaeon]